MTQIIDTPNLLEFGYVLLYFPLIVDYIYLLALQCHKSVDLGHPK